MAARPTADREASQRSQRDQEISGIVPISRMGLVERMAQTRRAAQAETPALGGAVKQLKVGVGDVAVVSARASIVTYGLGSCVAVCSVDPIARVGGLLHFMLPSKDSGRRDDPRIAVYADSGIEALLERMLRAGAQLKRIRTKLIGGAAVSAAVRMDIGKRNVLAARKLLWKQRLPVDAEETGGVIARTVRMDVPQGRLIISSPGTGERIL